MGKIFCLIGKSSTGKDAIFKLLLQRKDLTLNQIVSYTTRPIRDGERPGEEYNFVTIEEKEALEKKGKVVESRCYNTVFGDWYYFTVDDETIDLANKDYIIIGTVESFVKIRDYYGRDKVCPIYIEVEDGERLQRALNRERKQKQPKYEELCRRFLGDAADFSDDKIKAAGIDNIFNNEEDISDTVYAIAEFIKNN